MENLNILNKDSYTHTGNVIGITTEENMQDNQSQTHWIYAAAIMDSDGCFMISKSKSRSKNLNHFDYTPRVRVAMIASGATNYIHSETGLGNIFINGVRPSRPKSLPLFCWEITKTSSLIVFIKAILPYLKVKKDRAEHLLSFCLKRERKIIGNRYTKPSVEELNYREDMYLKMREFNGNKVGATTKSRERESVCDSLNS